MEIRHQEYIDYYHVRMKKYENNSLYPHSYQSEKELYEAIANSKDLEEFGRKVDEGNLAVENAIALVKDQETARKNLYQELKEKIRLHAPLRILDVVDTVTTDTELVNSVSEIEGEVNVEITLDLFTDQIYHDLMILEEIEVYQKAEVPDEWKNEINQEYPQDLIDQGRKDWMDHVLPNAQQWDPHWQYDFDLIWEDRHRRLIPIPDQVLKMRIEQFKSYRGI